MEGWYSRRLGEEVKRLFVCFLFFSLFVYFTFLGERKARRGGGGGGHEDVGDQQFGNLWSIYLSMNKLGDF